MTRNKQGYYAIDKICKGKKKYTRTHAHNDAKDMAENGEILVAYKCKYCHYYHVGHAIDYDKAEAIGAELP